jgi:tRNA-2-methylthio-N6-dimethylallyladenosine synthase
VRDIGFAQAFSFKYSPRPGTPAAGAPHPVPETEKEARLAELQALLRDQQDAFARSRVGRTFDVLFTGPGRHPGQMAGRSPWLQPVHVEGPAALAGTVAAVRIAAAHPNSLSGLLAAGEASERNDQPREEPAPA